jgi:hypothetical protein
MRVGTLLTALRYEGFYVTGKPEFAWLTNHLLSQK